MDPAAARLLTDLNRVFYETQAEAFAESRPRLAPGILRVLAQVRPGQAVFEAGCGDGKAGRWLARHAPGGLYLGLDQSAAMLARARRYSAGESPAPVRFVQADLLTPAWPAAGGRLFDWALAFAVFHHLPGRAARGAALRALAGRVRAGGWLALSNWQFLTSARLRQRVAPWSVIGLTDADVEPGDYLLTWERAGRRGLRYVHQLDTAEVRALAAAAGLEVVEVFRSDGGSEALAEYVILHQPSADRHKPFATSRSP